MLSLRAVIDGMQNTPAELADARKEVTRYQARINWMRKHKMVGKTFLNSHPMGRLYKSLNARGLHDASVRRAALGGCPHTLRLLDPNVACPTILAIASPYIHWDEDRTLTIAEVRRVCTFPEDFIV